MDFLSFIGVTSMTFATLLPLILLVFVSLLFLPAICLGKIGRVADLGEAACAAVLLNVGTVLVIGTLLPFTFSLLTRKPLPGMAYPSLLVVLVIGALLTWFTWRWLEAVESQAAAIPRALVLTSYLLTGALLAVFGGTTFLLNLIARVVSTADSFVPEGWWAAPFLNFALGLVLFLVTYPLLTGKRLRFFKR